MSQATAAPKLTALSLRVQVLAQELHRHLCEHADEDEAVAAGDCTEPWNAFCDAAEALNARIVGDPPFSDSAATVRQAVRQARREGHYPPTNSEV